MWIRQERMQKRFKSIQLIDEYREKYDFVRVTEVALGWYDFCPD